MKEKLKKTTKNYILSDNNELIFKRNYKNKNVCSGKKKSIQFIYLFQLSIH